MKSGKQLLKDRIWQLRSLRATYQKQPFSTINTGKLKYRFIKTNYITKKPFNSLLGVHARENFDYELKLLNLNLREMLGK
jgi:hypothetical protein